MTTKQKIGAAMLALIVLVMLSIMFWALLQTSLIATVITFGSMVWTSVGVYLLISK